MNYADFLDRKRQLSGDFGFEPIELPDCLFPFQKHLVEWALRKGRAAIFADCGLGKTLMQLVWADNVARHTKGRVLILTPLAVSYQTVAEAQKFGIGAVRSAEGEGEADIIVTNYERLQHFDPAAFQGVVCDESSILKHFGGATQKKLTRFMAKLKYRLLCTATAAPNDYVELGTSSEALGELTHSEMLSRFFRQRDDKGQKQDQKLQDEAEKVANHFGKLSFRVAQTIGQYRLKHHSVDEFWRWVTSWAMACRKPSDLGFTDDGYNLPDLTERDHVIMPNEPAEGMLFTMPAFGLQEEREERKRTMGERCDLARSLVDHDRPAVVWCHYNPEGDLLEDVIPDAVQIAGSTSDEKKEKIYKGFAEGSIRVLVTKPKIGAWGLNWQHCNHVVSFASHSFEQYYQSVRRCWRFGQERPVHLDVIASEGEKRVLENMRRKAVQADYMFEILVKKMNEPKTIKSDNQYIHKVKGPSWL